MAATKNPLVRLYHIRDEIEGVAVMLSNLEFDRYAESYPTTDWNRLRSLGNFLRHEYHHIDLEQLWSIATQKLPELGPTIRLMIADLER